MATSREIKHNYQVFSPNISVLVTDLNRIFALISERLDIIEGLRGDSPFASSGQQHIADAPTAHTTVTTNDLDVLGLWINAVIAALESSGLTKGS
jgi:hypothetical protein